MYSGETQEVIDLETDPVISDITPSSDGFAFHVELPISGEWEMNEYGWAALSVKVTLTLRCDDSTSDTQMVESTTYLNIQVAIKDRNTAAVASMRWTHQI